VRGLFAADSASFVEQFWPILAAGTFGVGGALLGKAFERRHSREAWRNEQRLAAYGELSAYVLAALEWTTRVYGKPDLAVTSRQQMESELRGGIGSAGLVSILGPDDVTDRVADMIRAVEQVVELAAASDADGPTPLQDTDELRNSVVAWHRFVDSARAALGINDAQSDTSYRSAFLRRESSPSDRT
jgi:hypothetical protein